jgi:inorganic triphosphatase YgiF
MPMGSPPVETELKLRVPSPAMQRLGTHPALRSGELGPRRKLRAIYYDTPDLALSRAGVALRVRREGRRWIQTVKWAGDVVGSLHRRNESEVEVAGSVPDLGRFDPEVAALFSSPDIADALQPVFETNFTRAKRVVVLDDASRVEASLDRGKIRSGERVEDLSELELELKAGTVPALFELALKIAATTPVALEARSKAERGYALYQNAKQAPVKASAPPLSNEMSVSDAFAAVAQENLRQLQANEEGTLTGKDPEFLHQMRVALRRLRSTFSAFSHALPPDCGDKVKADLRWLGNRLGPARDWDVFVTETLPAVRAAIGEDAAFEPLLAAARSRRTAAQREVRRALRSRRYPQVMLGLSCWLASRSWLDGADEDRRAHLEAPVRAYAQAELERRYERVRRRGRDLDELDAPGRHQLRIAIKKLRYSVEFFAPLFDPEASRALRTRLARLQDILGTMNDAATLERLLSEIPADPKDPAMVETRGVLTGWSAGRGDALHAELDRTWKSFRRTPTFW